MSILCKFECPFYLSFDLGFMAPAPDLAGAAELLPLPLSDLLPVLDGPLSGFSPVFAMLFKIKVILLCLAFRIWPLQYYLCRKGI